LAWVLTLTRHKAIDRLRATQRRLARLVPDSEAEIVQNYAAPAPTASEAARATEQGQLIRDALAELPAQQRRAIELAFFDGLSQTEIATVLNEPLGTIKARIRRGMLKLRDDLKQRL
jgi:RNA polymerase sigma-70 factor (ECF subfamily)